MSNEYKFGVTGSERKRLVGDISNILNTPMNYLGAPTFAYEVGGYHIDREGTVTGQYDMNLFVGLAERGFEPEASKTFHLITPRGTLLIQERFDTAEEAEAAGYGCYFHHEGRDVYAKAAPNGKTEHSKHFVVVGAPFEKALETIAEPEEDTEVDTQEAADTAEITEPDRLAIEYPLEAFTPHSRINLEKLVVSKAVLIKEALGISDLPIEETDQTLRFPWFPADCDSDTVKAYAGFITALCDTAIKKSRVVAKAQESFENPRFAMRVWLIGLGLVGKEFDLCRKLMMSGLSGNSGFRYGKPEEGAAPRRDGIHRDAISIRLMPDTLEKLSALAARSESETGQHTSRNMIIEQAVEAYIRETAGVLETPEPATRPDRLAEALADAELIHNVNKLLAEESEVIGDA